ncbi:MAG: hypothetical protein ACI92S_003948, partial [Planctomycetaceae bacterium]
MIEVANSGMMKKLGHSASIQWAYAGKMSIVDGMFRFEMSDSKLQGHIRHRLP